MSRLYLAAPLVIAALVGPVAAQPDLAAPAPAPAPAATAAFDQALDALLGREGGLTAAAAGARAARVSPTAERKDAETAEARAKVREIQRAILPIVNVGASYTRLSSIDPPSIGVNPQTGAPILLPVFFNAWHVGGDVALPLTDLFVRLPVARDAARDGVVAAELSARAARLGAGVDAQVAYYEWVRAQLQVAATTQLVTQVQGNVAQVQSLVDVKRAAIGDLLRVQAQKAQTELALARIEALVGIRELQLRLAIGAADDETLTIGEDVRQAIVAPGLPANPQLVADARGRRLESKALAAASHAYERGLAGSKVGALPRLDLYGQVAHDNPSQRIFPQEGEFNLTWAAGVRVTWSLNSYLSVDPQVAQARARIQALAADQRAIDLGIRAEVESARSSFELAQRTLASATEGLVAAEETYRVRQELLTNDRATAIELVDAQTAIIQARFASIDALIDRRIAWVRLRHAAGLDLP